MQPEFDASTLVGWWVAEDGKAALVEPGPAAGSLVVSVQPRQGAAPYRSADLLGGGTKPVERLVATPDVQDGLRFLRIEAGTESLGPTYRLYPVRRGDDGWLPVDASSPATAPEALLPNTRIGLYDDWEDDLGVPWAYPLLPLIRAPG